MIDATVEAEMRAKSMLDDDDVARLLDIKRRTVQQRAQRGKFPKPLMGGRPKERRIWSSRAFFQWIESNGRTDR